MRPEALDLERNNGGERTEIKCRKDKIMICGACLDLLQSSGEFTCAVCHTGVGSNSIFCKGCKHWVQKKCSGLNRLAKDPNHRCTRCQGTARPLDSIPQREVQVGPEKQKVVASLCYLEDMLSTAGGCELSTATSKNSPEEVYGALTSSVPTSCLSRQTRGRMYSSCVRNVMLHDSETWPLTKPNRKCLQRNDRAMIRQSCNVKPQDSHHQVQLATCLAWHWGAGPHSEGEKALLVWTCGTLQWCIQDSLWHTG